MHLSACLQKDKKTKEQEDDSEEKKETVDESKKRPVIDAQTSIRYMNSKGTPKELYLTRCLVLWPVSRLCLPFLQFEIKLCGWIGIVHLHYLLYPLHLGICWNWFSIDEPKFLRCSDCYHTVHWLSCKYITMLHVKILEASYWGFWCIAILLSIETHNECRILYLHPLFDLIAHDTNSCRPH